MCTLLQYSRLFCAFHWQLPRWRISFCCLSSYWRISQSVRSVRFPAVSSRCEGTEPYQSHGEMKDVRVGRVALTQPSCARSTWEGVGTREENCWFAWCSEWVKHKVHHVSLAKYCYWNCCREFKLRGVQRLYMLFIVCVCVQTVPSGVF